MSIDEMGANWQRLLDGARILKGSTGHDKEGRELQQLIVNWPKLAARVRAAILVLAEVRTPPGAGPRRETKRAQKGEPPAWLMPALNILKDSEGKLSDREIAERLEVSHSTLSRSPEYQQAKKTYITDVRRVARGGPRHYRLR